MKRVVLFVALILAISAGCRKKPDSAEPTGGQGWGGGGGAGGGVMGVRGAVDRVVTAAELHDLHIFMSNSKLANGRVPTSQETWAALNEPSGNPKLVALIKDGILILVPNPPEEGLWAYSKDAPTQGGWVLTHSEPRRVTAAEFAELSKGH